MGQCSTLPADKNATKTGGNASDVNSRPSGSSGNRSSYKQQREERDAYHGSGPSDDRQHGDVIMADGNAYAPSPRAESSGRRDRDVGRMMQVVKEDNHKFDTFINDGTEASQGSAYHSTNSSRSSRHSGTRAVSVPDAREEYIPPPPEGSVRTRCYRLNLDVPTVLSPTHDSLGPFHYSVPIHLLPSSSRGISLSMSSDSVDKSGTQIAVETARIFRGIKVDNNGTIVSRNDRASRSRRSSNNTSKTAENSRQSAKIIKANDLVDEMVASGKENDGEKPNMISIYPVGEYDDMKQLVRDGAKKLRDADKLPDDSIFSLNRHRNTARNSSRRSSTDYPTTPNSSRRRLSSSYPDIPTTPQSTSSRSKSRAKLQAHPQSAPPKLKSHPRDRPSSRRMNIPDERNTRYGEKCNNMSLFGGGDSDWSEALNFNSIWNCGGTGTMSPSNNKSAGQADGHNGGRMSSSTVRYEGRNESSTRFSRGVSERDAPLVL